MPVNADKTDREIMDEVQYNSVKRSIDSLRAKHVEALSLIYRMELSNEYHHAIDHGDEEGPKLTRYEWQKQIMVIDRAYERIGREIIGTKKKGK